ncbi:hypothetical protein RND61_28695 [Streptomyces sp. TRM76323]|uniref:Sel1 repeat family protein n=1 Tax=Streptomyces tamarix TaxID=3078565 RepID=A0ABU3QTI4_9ACTN|nr:hypothetical protein [Streptomyces tamarix]MDT9686019.1 hypothetical protein [Streptomyces tamarix]
MGGDQTRDATVTTVLRAVRSERHGELIERLKAFDKPAARGFGQLVANDRAARARVDGGPHVVRAEAEHWLRWAATRDPRTLAELCSFVREVTSERARDLRRDVRRPADEAPPAGDAPAAPTRNTVSGGTAAHLVQAGYIGSVQYGAEAPDDPALWWEAATADPLALGTRHEGPYVPRDRDADLAGAGECGFLVITGERLSGKTTTAWAHLRRFAPGTEVCVPLPGADLRTLPGWIRARDNDCVLWLDDLERYLDADRGLDAALLSRFMAMGVPVVATMSDAAYDEYRFGSLTSGRLLGRARTVELDLEWSAAELARLKGARDAHLQGAYTWRGDRSVTEYLAVGPELWEEWRRAGRPSGNRSGHQLVRAALDLARCGLTGPLPRDVVRAVYETYAPKHAEAFDAALAWATRPRLGVTGLLVEAPGTAELAAYGSLIGEALVTKGLPRVPYEVWDLALAHDRQAVSVRALQHFRAWAKADDREAMYRLAQLLHDEDWLRGAADAGHPGAMAELGRVLADRGEARAAEPYLERAAEAGAAGAATLLGTLLRDRAMGWLRKGADEGDPEAAHHLGDLLFGLGDDQGALKHYVDAFEAEYAEVAGSLGAYHLYRGDSLLAEIFFRRAADAGDTRREGHLARHDPVTPEGTEEYLREFSWHPMDATHLGAFLEGRGDRDQARTWYEKGFELGDPYGAFLLARLLEKEGRKDEAAAWMRKAADAGHPGAAEDLGGGADTVVG